MAVYVYSAKDGETRDEVFPMGKQPLKVTRDGKDYHYDICATLSGVSTPAVQYPYNSESLGCMPDQVGEFRQHYPGHNYNRDGTVEVTSRRHRDQIARDRGYLE